tara:strand:+ start:397 stop:744 length:348 start_codon:yes stop_codon:yes gene_type:complete
MHDEITSKYTVFYRQMNISGEDFNRLKEKSEKSDEEQVVTIQGIFAAMDTDEHAKKFDDNSHIHDGFTKVMFKININDIDEDVQPPAGEGKNCTFISQFSKKDKNKAKNFFFYQP